jgi:hypothetical protein
MLKFVCFHVLAGFSMIIILTLSYKGINIFAIRRDVGKGDFLGCYARCIFYVFKC